MSDCSLSVAQVLCSASFAGAEAVACSLARALRGRVGRSLIYLILELRAGAAACAALEARVRGFGVEVRCFTTASRWSWRLLRQLAAALAADRIDVVHSHSYKAAVLMPLLRSVQRDRPRALVFTLHGVDLPPSVGRLFVGSLTAGGALFADRVLACSRPLERSYRRWPLLQGKTLLVPNGLRPEWPMPLETLSRNRAAWRAALAARFGLDERACWIAIVGRLVAVKNHALLLRALAALEGRLDWATPVALLVVGAGPLRDELAAEARRLGIDRRVAFSGQVDEMEAVYGGSDVLALVSRDEGTPMAIAEAMAFARPVVATRVGGIVDQVVDGETALLVDGGDAAGLTTQLERLVRDADLRARLGQAGWRRAIAAFSAAHWAERHLSVYRSALGIADA
ncbi:MAG: glycosyltransferase family 4 protein [Proteobacteria bacterium]|nr:glycosyltransferase family 4 protein [Pseudomonadota bacterium]